jgi:ABC-2 type transport system permease protein
MNSLAALIKREYLEHRGAFLYAPAILLLLFTLAFGSSLATNKMRIPFDVQVSEAMKFFELAFLGMGALWLAYLMVALFFYFADAFNADRRNNAMLFWKSMPQSDFKMLMSKMLAGMTILPALIFAAFVVTGLVLYGLTALAVTLLPMLQVPGLGEVIASSGEMGLLAIVYLALSLLWYAPFFAFVGLLSTMVGRWSIPLAFLIPGLAILVENLLVRGLIGIVGSVFMPGSPRAGYIFDYLSSRFTFGFTQQQFERVFMRDPSVDAMRMITELIGNIDWVQMTGGLIVAVLFVFLASEYRRRVISS